MRRSARAAGARVERALKILAEQAPEHLIVAGQKPENIVRYVLTSPEKS